MFKLKLLIPIIIIGFIFQSCSTILEPVLFDGKLGNFVKKEQEEFNVNIDILNFENTRKLNKDPYPRQLMLTGSGGRANVINEEELLKSRLPKQLTNYDYHIGIGDTLTFSYLNEFQNKKVIWPISSSSKLYRLGVGDELVFIQSKVSERLKLNSAGGIEAVDETFASIKGYVGSNGYILLLGVGKLKAENKTLDELRIEIRNILIRDGLTPNFQLEISQFMSKKVYISINGKKGEVSYINNITQSLKELVIIAGLSKADKNSALVTLTRNRKDYYFTAEQLFASDAPEIFIINNDIININLKPKIVQNVEATVSANGKIYLPNIGTIFVVNKTLEELNIEIHEALKNEGLISTFQLDLSGFVSKKIYMLNKTLGSKVIPLTNFKTTLKDLVLNNDNFSTKSEGIFLISLKRYGEIYRFTLAELLNPKMPDIWMKGDDQIEIEFVEYKPGQVYALSGAGNALILPIKPSVRETLANVLFVPNGAFGNLSARRSEVYLLRGQNPAVAYHLDAQDVSRILVAAKTELRPNDIIYVADRPIISFSRTLAEITPLRILLRDLDNGTIP